MLVSIGIMAFLGYKIDGWLGLTFPVFMISLLFLTFGGMIYQLYKSIQKED